MRALSILCCGLMMLCLSDTAKSQSLEFHLNELPWELNQNIQAHLSDLPDTDLERRAFLYSANREVREALAALGYYHSDVVISVDRTEEVWQMKIMVTPNEPTLIESVDIQVNGEAANDDAFRELLANLPLAEGQRIHHGRYEELKSSIQSLAQERGYFDGRLVDSQLRINRDLKTAVILIDYDSGDRYRFGEVVFDQDSVSDDLLDNLVQFKTGDYYLNSSLYGLQNELQRTGYFGSTLVLPDRKNIQGKQIPINVSHTNANRYNIDLGAGFATDTRARVSVGWTMPLVNKSGHSMDAKIAYSEINPIGQFTYTIPVSHPLNDVMHFQLRLEDNEYGDLDSRYYSVSAGRTRSSHGWVHNFYLRFLDENWNYTKFNDNGTYLMPGVRLSRTRRKGAVLDPGSGFAQSYNVEAGHSAFGSEINLIRLGAQWSWVRTIALGHRLVARAEVGTNIIDSDEEFDLAPSLRFFAGGDQSIRGFRYQSLGPTLLIDNPSGEKVEIVVGGRNLAVASLEYQYYLNDEWRLGFFTDGGNAFDPGKFNAEYSIGTGVHWISPVGAIRFDLGYSLSRDDPSFRIHLNLGSEL